MCYNVTNKNSQNNKIDIKKALQDIAKAIENNDSVSSVKVVITLKKSSKAKPKAINNRLGVGDGQSSPCKFYSNNLLNFCQLKRRLKNDN